MVNCRLAKTRWSPPVKEGKYGVRSGRWAGGRKGPPLTCLVSTSHLHLPPCLGQCPTLLHVSSTEHSPGM